LAFVALFFFGLLHGEEVVGQTAPRRDFEHGMRSGIGYTAVIPDVMAGIGAWHVVGSGRFGVFADAKMSYPDLGNDSDYCPAVILPCTVEDIEAEGIHLELRDVDQFAIFNVGAMIVVGPEISFLVGAGPVRHSRFREYADIVNDLDLLITDDGTFWVPREPASEWGAQAVVGALMRLGGRVVIRFGYETSPGGISVGGYWAFSG
jgi:hypothetical protein